MSINPFDFVNAINQSKENLFETKGYTEGDYPKYLINRQFSLFSDTIYIANCANEILNNIPNKSHFEFYLSMVAPKRRYAKWIKPDENEHIKLLCTKYQISPNKAMEIIDLFTKGDLKELEKRFECGGKGNNRQPTRGED